MARRMNSDTKSYLFGLGGFVGAVLFARFSFEGFAKILGMAGLDVQLVD